MLDVENNNFEYKQEYTPNLKKDVVAFANGEGGTILIGVTADSEVIGVADPDGDMVKVANALKDSISPDIMPCIHLQKIMIEGKDIIEISVKTGVNRPYYIKEKGYKPSGVYERKGSSSQPVSDERIREMVVESYSESYEDQISANQELTFKCLKEELKNRNIKCGKAQFKTLKLINQNDLYTNLAYVLSDQFEVSTKVALFEGSDKMVFRDRKEFSGSILNQMNELLTYLDFYNKTKATFGKVLRTDTKDYPEAALREAVLNSFVHRDYSRSTSNIINVYSDKIEIISVGGLIPTMDIDSIYLGLSETRNAHLANLFYRMKLIESYGTGIQKMMKAYSDFEVKPKFEAAKGVFKVTLPNCNHSDDNEDIKNKKYNLTPEAEEILNYMTTKQVVSRKEIDQLLNISKSKSTQLLNLLCAENIILSEGEGKSTRYRKK